MSCLGRVTYCARMSDSVRVVRWDGPAYERLIAEGWLVDSTSWGARLRLDGERAERLRNLVRTYRDRGVTVEELSSGEAALVVELENITFDDYPQTAATVHEQLTAEAAADLFVEGRVFAVRRGGQVVAVTAAFVQDGLVETRFTSVHPDHRRQGLATLVKAASVLAFAEQGHTWFGTGGAGSNTASRAMNEAVGYVITETWHTLVPPLEPERSPVARLRAQA